MTTDQAVALLREFQSLAVGMVGFTGVIITIAMNARLARSQHARKVEHDARALRAALVAELQLVREAFLSRMSAIDNANGRNQSLVPLESMTDVYAGHIHQIGLLSEAEATAVVRTYTLLKQFPERMELLSRRHATDREKSSGWAEIGSDLFEAIKSMHHNYLLDIDAALVELRRHT